MTLNKAMLIGRLGKDPEVRFTKSGSAVASFSLATDENWKDKAGNRQERTEWHNIVAWAKLADFVQNYLKKGRLIYVEGRIQTRDWTDNQSVKHWKTEIIANSIRFVGPPPDGAGRGVEGGSSGGKSQDRGRSGPPEQGEPPPPQPEGEYPEDDIPF